MSNHRGTLQSIALHLAGVVAPLDRSFRDLDAFQLLMWRLGWEVLDLPPSYAAVADAAAAAATAAAALADDPEIDDVFALIDAVRDAYSVLGNITDAPAGTDPVAFLAEIAPRLFEYLLGDYLLANVPTLFATLELLAVIRLEYVEPATGRPDYVRTHFDWDWLPTALSDPGSIPVRAFSWGTADFEFVRAAELVSELADSLRLPGSVDRVAADYAAAIEALGTGTEPVSVGFTVPFFDLPVPSGYEEVGLQVTELPADGSALPGIFIGPMVPSDIPSEFSLNEDWTFIVRAGTDLADQLGIVVRPGEVAVRYPFAPDKELPAAGFGAELVYAPATPRLLFGQPESSSLQLGGLRAGLGVDRRGDLVDLRVSFGLEDLVFILPAADLGDILATLLKRDVSVPLAFRLAWSNATGLSFAVGAGLAVSVFPDIKIGPLHIAEFRLALRAAAASGQPVDLVLETTVSFDGVLGPIGLTVSDVGLRLALELGDGPFGLDYGFVPPSGFGLAIAAGPVSGGGFLRREAGPPERYAGALGLKLTRFSVTSFGLFERTASGRISFAVVIGIRFNPGIQLGFGFILTGIGGMLGINRRADVDALKRTLSKGTAGNVLFADDPVKNAPTLIGDLRTLFPVADGVHVVGPTVQITWLEIARFDLGIIFELPGPSKILIIGVARIEIGGKNGLPALIQLRCDIVGPIDLVKKLVALDAKLINSKLLQIFTLTGDAAFRLSTGADPYAMLTVGGFHPAFNPEPAVFSSLERISLAYDRGGLWMRLDSYFAITSNTVQHGAALEVGIEAGSLNANGFLGYDALIQLVPFYFTVDLEARVRVRWRSRTIAGVKFSGNLSGPGPLVLRGKFCISFFFFDVCWNDSFHLGKTVTQTVTDIASLVPVIAKELEAPANLQATGEDAQVALLAPPANLKKVVITPLGDLIWAQKRVPLNVAVERFEGVPLRDRQSQAVVVEVTSTRPVEIEAAEDWFSPGTFINLSESEALNRSGFQREEAGVRVGFPIAQSEPVTMDVTTVTFRLPEPLSIEFDFEKVFPPSLMDAVQERRSPGRVFDAPQIFTVEVEKWTVCSPDGTVTHSNVKQTDAHQRSRYEKGATALPELDVADQIELGGL